MKKNSWKTFLSVVLLLTMLVSMLPSAAFADDAQSADAQTAAEETVKVEENKDAAKAEPKAENKDAAKEEPKTENKEEVKGEAEPEKQAEEEPKAEPEKQAEEEPAAEPEEKAEEEPKEEPKEESEEESEDEPKDEAEEMSDAVKAFLAAVEAIDAENPDPAALEAAQIQHDALSEEEQALPEVAAAFEKLLGLIGYGVDTQVNSSVPLTLIVSSYSAPFINGSTGEHTVGSIKASKYIYLKDVGSDNASGSATARFVGSNETGWTLVIDVVIGNYSETWTTNARITNKDMSAATGSITFGLSFNTAGGTSTYIHISGGTAIMSSTTLKYDANCTDSTGTVPAAETKSVEKGKTGSFTVKGQGDMAREGYKFLGWTESKDGTGTLYTAGMTISVAAGTTKTLYAKWEPLPTKATVIYHVNGGTATNGDPVTEEVDPGQYTIKNPAQVGFTAPSGKQFLYWTTAAQEGAGVTAYNAGTKENLSAGDTLELWAQWETGSTEPPTPDTPDWDGLDITKEITEPADTTTVAPGDEITYKITVKNNTGVDLTDVVVVDTLPAGVTFVSTSAGDPGNGTVTVTIATLAKGAEYSFTVTVTVDADTVGTITNTAKIVNAVGGGTELGEGKSASVTTPVEAKPEANWDGLTITKSVDKDKVLPGEELEYTITVKNETGVDLTNIFVKDALPAGVTYKSHVVSTNFGILTAGANNNFNGTIWSLKNGDSETIKITVTVNSLPNAPAAVTNTASIASASDGTTTRTETIVSNSVTTVVILWHKLVLEKSDNYNSPNDAIAWPGDDIIYTVTITNNTGIDIDSVNGTDTLPYSDIENIKVTSNDANLECNYNGTDTIKYTATNLKNGDTVSFTVSAKIKAGVTEIYNTATIDSASNGYNDTNKGYSVTIRTLVSAEPPIEISKSVNVPTADPGDELTYMITVKNKTNSIRTANLVDTLPAGITDVTFVAGSEGTYDSAKGTITWTKDIPAKSSINILFKAKIDANFAGDVIAANHVVATVDSVEYPADSARVDITQPSPVEVPAKVVVNFVGIDTLPEGYTLTGDAANPFLTGALTPLTKDAANKTITYTAPANISALLNKAYDLKFMQSNYNVDGYTCDKAAAVTATATAASKETGMVVTITLTYTKTDPAKTEMPVAVNVKFVGLDKDTALPAGYTLTGAVGNEFLNGAIALAKDETADTAIYTGRIQAVPGKAYSLSFIQSGFDVDGYICDASAVVTKNVTADATNGVVVDIVLNYTKINWGGLTITKTADKTYATPGSYVKYTITVTNNTGVDLTNVNVLDYLPSEVRFSSSIGYDSDTSSWTIARLADGKSATVTIRVRLNSGLSTGTKIENTAYVTSVTIDGQTYVFENLWLNDSAVVIVTNGKGAPKTGDESNIGLWIAVMAASLACAGAAAVIYKKRRTGND